ncbi:hypothetical protein [Kitasatospora sp. NPDC088779]|uniref:WD40 repeat domain-containing protein n=1 Tax=Kitasatospora sp. NPDC088779 TaxID=3154964 RepID=UPI00343811D7
MAIHHRSVLAFSPDGRTIATGSLDATVMLWDTSRPAETHRLGQPLTGHNSGVRALAFSPDDHTLVSGSADRTVIVWEVTNPVQPYNLGGTSTRTGAITAVAVTPDGKTLPPGAEDKIVNVNDLGALDELRNHARTLACTRAGGGLSASGWRTYVPGLSYRQTPPPAGRPAHAAGSRSSAPWHIPWTSADTANGRAPVAHLCQPADRPVRVRVRRKAHRD